MRQGTEAEDRAADYLLKQGYTLISRRFTVRGGELDLVVLDGDELVFVEVRARANAEESLSPKKSEAMRRAASEFLNRMEIQPATFRFDLIAVSGDEFRHYKGLSE